MEFIVVALLIFFVVVVVLMPIVFFVMFAVGASAAVRDSQRAQNQYRHHR